MMARLRKLILERARLSRRFFARRVSGPGARAPRTRFIALAALAVGLAPGAGATPLFVDCRGAATSAPTVILEAGAFGTSADWDYILDDLAKGGRVCAYDRAGVGRSADDRGDRGVLAKAAELGALLGQLGETGKVILVGHSNGALYIEAFARLHPERVAGLVYVNGVNGTAADDPLLLGDLKTEREMSGLAAVAGHLGLAPLMANALAHGERLAPEADARKREALRCVACLVVARDEDRLIVPGLDVVNRLGPQGVRHIPTVVIVGAPYPKQRLARAWRAAEIKPAALADRSWILDAPGASHVSPLARDRAYIDAAIGWLRTPFTTPPRSASTPMAPPASGPVPPGATR